MVTASDYRTVAIKTNQYELLRKILTVLNKNNPRTKDGIPITIRMGDILGFAVEELARKHKIK